MQEINTEIYLKKKKIKRENMKEIDIIIYLKKKKETTKRMSKNYSEANKSRKS